MRKQALIITAYRDEKNLLRLIMPFSKDNRFRVFVHIDKKSRELDGTCEQKLRESGVFVLRQYSITWGSIHHIHAVLDLIRVALEDKEITYFHVVSGSDMALHSPNWFAMKFMNDIESHFSNGIARVSERIHTYVWRTMYWMPSTWNPRSKFVKRLNDVAFWLQHKLGISRQFIGEIPMEDVRFGMIWSSFHSDAGKQMLRFAKEHPRFMRALNFTMVPEESFFVTALMGTPYEPKPDSRDFRFYEWTREMPAVLDESDYSKIMCGNYIFVRKIDSKKSAKLIEQLQSEMRD